MYRSRVRSEGSRVRREGSRVRREGSRVYYVGGIDEGQYHVTHEHPAFQAEGGGCRALAV